jgi:glycosyltransferase involved in cell wall biosynthesis
MRYWQREVMSGVPVVRVPLFPSHDRNPLGRVANYGSFALSSAILGPLLTDRADIVYAYHPPPTIGLGAAAFKRVHGVPFVYHIADMWPESVAESGMLGHGHLKTVATSVLSAYCKWVYSEAAAITVLSPGFKRLLVERGVAEEKVHVVYNWADDELFHPMPRDPALAKELGLASKTNIVYAGNFGTFQGLESVIRAAAKIKHVADLRVALVGTGVEEEKHRALATELRATNVLFLGRRPMTEMPAINALADALLVHLKDLPFFRATIPSKTQISLASGRPLIMAVAGDAAEVTRRANAGLVVPPDDIDALAGAMLELHMMTHDERERLGEHGHQFYLREMSLQVGTSRMETLFRDITTARRGVRLKTA